MNRERYIDKSVFAERKKSSQHCPLPGTSAPCSRNLHACYPRSAAAMIQAASPSRRARTMYASPFFLHDPLDCRSPAPTKPKSRPSSIVNSY